jgi:hypothetical protein
VSKKKRQEEIDRLRKEAKRIRKAANHRTQGGSSEDKILLDIAIKLDQQANHLETLHP